MNNQLTIEDIKQIIREELHSLIKTDRYTISKTMQFLDGMSIQTGRKLGTRIATEGGNSGQKLGFFGVTPVIQQTAITTPSGGMTVDTQARTSIGEIKTVLHNLGLTT